VRPPRLLRTASFRLAAAYTLLFAVSVAALGAFVLLTTRSALEQQMTGRLETEMGDLESELRSAGIDRLTATVRERAHGARALDYLVQDPAGRRIAGDLPPIGGRTGWIDVTSDDHGSGEAGDRERLRVLAKRLPDGTLLAVGEDAGHVEEATDAISSALWAALGLTVLLGIAGGLVLSAGFLRRIDQIVRTADAIVDGHLEQRIPESGTRDDLDHLAQTLNRMLDRIAELMAGMRQVSNAAAHELRTPLTHLRQNLESALAETRPAEPAQGAIQRALAETDAILETFAALLRIAQIEAGTRRAGFRPIDLGDVAETIVEAFAAPIEEQGRALVPSIGKGIRIRGDQELLAQLLANLVENASRHTPKGTRIELSLAATQTGARLIVADDGQGVPATERVRIFDRFHRLDRSAEGVGLGLSLVKAIADLHGAQIRVDDNAPGLRVIVEFGGGAEGAGAEA
jgi:signal transduction histidine kinase